MYIYIFYRYINVIHTISMLQKISYNALGHVYVISKIWNGILGSTKIVPVLTYCICFVWEEKLPNIARHLFEFFWVFFSTKHIWVLQHFIALKWQFIIPPTTLFIADRNWHQTGTYNIFFTSVQTPPPAYSLFSTPLPLLTTFWGVLPTPLYNQNWNSP